MAEARGASTPVSSSSPPDSRGDPLLLGEMIANWCNALAYTLPPEEVTVRCRSHEHLCVIGVERQQTGHSQIPPNLFEHFFRLPSASRPGNGLGLPIVPVARGCMRHRHPWRAAGRRSTPGPGGAGRPRLKRTPHLPLSCRSPRSGIPCRHAARVPSRTRSTAAEQSGSAGLSAQENADAGGRRRLRNLRSRVRLHWSSDSGR